MTLANYIWIKLITSFTTISTLTTSNWYITIPLSLLAYFAPIATIFHFLIFAVGIDLLSGLAKAWKLKEKVTSWRLRDTVIKLFLYIALTMLVYGIEVTCLWGLPLSNIIATFILFAEAVSIAENIDVISDGKLGLAKFLKSIRKKWFKKVDEK